MTSYKEKLNPVTTFIFDVDGVLTDGSVTLYKDETVRTMNSRDGYALQFAAKMGYRILIITSGHSRAVESKLLYYGATEVCMEVNNKFEVYASLKEKYGYKDAEVLYMGDDIPDYQVMRHVGISACPQDAAMEIKAMCDYQSPYFGGRHCVRDVIEQTLRVQGKWFSNEGNIE